MMAQTGQPIERADFKEVRGVCLDIDDTLSSGGKLTAPAFAALWKLKEKGFCVLPITGRPAGWCDHIARFWPVDAVVGENGAFSFFMKDGVRQRLETPMEYSREEAQGKLQALRKQILDEFPEARWASDQAYREYDLAIDFCEDVPHWSEESIRRLLQLCEEQGAVAKRSSIHINAWFGSYKKADGFRHWLKKEGPSELQSLDQWVMIGDSPNDEPMFKVFSHSVGVANIQPYLSSLQTPPRWVTSRPSGEGFCEFVDQLIRTA